MQLEYSLLPPHNELDTFLCIGGKLYKKKTHLTKE